MHLDLPSIVWIVAIVIGIVSSLVRKGRQPAAPAAPRAVSAPRADAPQTVHQQLVQTIESQPPVVKRHKAPQPSQPPPTMHEPHETNETPSFRGMFERGALVRAIVAAEVLGPPKALQEQSIWSPRHSEPSI